MFSINGVFLAIIVIGAAYVLTLLQLIGTAP